MEPANGCRICMTILSGSVQGSLGLVYGGLAGRNLRSPPATPRHPTTDRQNGKLRGCDGIDAYPGVRGSDLHTALRRRRTIASIRPGPNLRKGTSYDGENCGGLHLVARVREPAMKSVGKPDAANPHVPFDDPG